MNLIAADRKRRLTDSADGPGRRRTSSGGFQAQALTGPSGNVSGPSSSFDPQGMMSRISGYRQEGMRTQMLSQLRRRSNGSSRSDNVPPRWQPDAEVNRCPICGVQFTWYYRKHHCRKCGRVVCANCSPHRITIPRQYIVHPPDTNQRTSIISNPDDHNVIDLTGNEATDRTMERPALRRPGSSQYSNPALGGGEEVRLCNPCVPDPQPEPQAFNISGRPGQGIRWPGDADFVSAYGGLARPNQYPREDQTTSWLAEQARIGQARMELSRRRARGMTVSITIARLSVVT